MDTSHTVSIGMSPPNPDFPRIVFIVGMQRSGTTAMLGALRKATGWPGDREGHLWPLLDLFEQLIAELHKRVESDSEDVTDFSLFKIDAPGLIEAVATELARQSSRRFRSHVWLDKTPGPEMIRCCPLIARFVPGARFIFMHRHPVANVASLERRFPQHEFRTHVDRWVKTNGSWLNMRETLASPYLEIGQDLMLQDPSGAAARVGNFLALTAQQVAGVAQSLETTFPEQTRLVVRGTETHLDELTSDPDDRRYFFERCSRIAALLGYTIGQGSDPKANPMVFYGTRRIALFYPVSETPYIQVQGANSYCYRRSLEEFQICPNRQEAQPFELVYRNVPLAGHNRLVGQWEREFSTGPPLVMTLTICDASNDAILGETEVAVDGPDQHELSLEFAPAPRVHVKLGLRLADPGQPCDFSTVIVRRLALDLAPVEARSQADQLRHQIGATPLPDPSPDGDAAARPVGAMTDPAVESV